MTTNQTIDGVPRELVRENIAYLRGMGGTYSEKSALAAKFEALLLEPEPAKDLREQYEAWADANGYDITRNDHGDYAGLVEDSMWTGWQARSELRALLDAPACSACNDTGRMHEPGCEPGACTACLEKPAAQPQPLARVEIGADRNAALTVTNDDWLRSLKDRGVHQIVSLYAEQPAPVAVEYKLHMGAALKVFDALKVERIARKVEQEELGPMGATEVETWSSSIGVTLEMHTAMGGCTLIVRSAPTATS